MTDHDPEENLPEHHNPLPEVSGGGEEAAIPPHVFSEVRDSEEYVRLRRAFRSFAFPMTFAFLAWYFFYVLASTYAPGFMSTPVLGSINLGILLGLGQFVSTFLITWLYVRRANNTLDPMAASLREKLEASR